MGQPRSAVPSARAKLVGRSDERDRALALVVDPEVRLVTITGRSGVGKTVLAHEVVRTILAETTLATATVVADHGSGPASVARVLAALDGAAEGGSPVGGAAPDGRRRVVLLDGLDDLNATEESAAALPLVSQALDEWPDLTVLATSTAPLGLRGEHLVRLAPLAVPDPKARSLDALATSPAVALLADRIAASDPAFVLDATAAAHAATICRALDGLPLALELVAPTCASLGVAEVATRVAGEVPFGLLAVGPSDADERHRDLRATIAWSYERLTEPQQRALRALATFVESFSLDAAAALMDLDDAGAIEVVEQLVAGGLVDRTTAASGAPRFRLAATIRSFAREEAERQGERTVLRARHAAHHRAVARATAITLGAVEGIDLQHRALDDLEEHLAAFDATVADGVAAETVQYAADLAPVWIDAGMATAGIELLGAPLRTFEPASAAELHLAAEAWAWGSTLAVMSGSASAALVEEQLVQLRAAVFAAPEPSVEQRLLLVEMLLQARVYTGDLEAAEPLAAEADELALEGADTVGAPRALSLAAVVANQRGEHAIALARAERARRLALDIGDERQAFRACMVLAGIPGATSAPPPEDLLAMARRVGDRTIEGPAAIVVALDRVGGGDTAGAAEVLAEALELGQRHGYWHVEEMAVLALSVIAAGAGRFDDVARLHGGVHRHLETLRRFLSPSHLAVYDGVIDAVRAADLPTFDRAMAAGELLSWNGVLSMAWDLIDELRSGPMPEEPAPTPTDHGEALGLPGLTDREREVLALLSEGLTNKAIAAQLGLRPKTVMHHTSSIYRKLGVTTRTEAAAAALRAGTT